MATNLIEIDPSIEYPEKWTPMRYECACGARCRVDVEVVLGFRQGGELFKHCHKDDEHYMPGRIIQAYLET